MVCSIRYEIIENLCCPDDGEKVLLDGKYLKCSRCFRSFPIWAENLFEIKPVIFSEWNLDKHENLSAEYGYKRIYEVPFSWEKKSHGWGYLKDAAPSYRLFVGEENDKINKILNVSKQMLGIDVSGGVGNYSIPMSSRVRGIVHCELEVQSLITAYQEAKGRDNIVFIRSFYLNLPFESGSFDFAICTDTLIRGKRHDLKLISEICRVLKDGGRAAIDFHNPKVIGGNKDICFYNVNSIRELLSSVGVKQYSIYPVGFIPGMILPVELRKSTYRVLNKLCSLFLPAKRHIVVFTKTSRANA